MQKTISGLYVIVDSARLGEEVLEGGCRLIQLRNKKLSDASLLEEALKLREITRRKDALLIINDRLDIALIVEADGLHLGKDDIPIEKARKFWGNRIIGFSADSLEEALEAEKRGADYVSIGPIFPTQSKEDLPPPLGTDIISSLKAVLSVPVVAIGGINESNIQEVVEKGASAVAVISAVCSAPSPRQAVERLIRLMQEKEMR